MSHQSEKQLAAGSRQWAVKAKSSMWHNASAHNCPLPTAHCLLLLLLLLIAPACRRSGEKKGLRPNTLGGVPAARLAYSFAADTEAPPGGVVEEESKLKPIEADFDVRRKDDRLLRTVVSPDGLRALAVYDTGETQEGEFRIDLYSAEGKFLRNMTPTELSGAFAPMVAWSPDGNYIAFIGRKSLTPQTPPEMIPDTVTAVPPGAPLPSPSVAPAFTAVPVYDTEQIYICNRDGFELKPMTTRGGLIYFYLAWSPDNQSLVALACPEDEWEVRERENKLPAGRPRIIGVDGSEHLLDDGLTEAGPVWSPDASKVAAAFETEVKIYDAGTDEPTRASIPLRDPLLKASADYDEKKLKAKKSGEANGKGDTAAPASQTSGTPVSFNAIVRLNWPEAKTLFIQTAYIRIYSSEPVVTFQRWHKLNLSLQAGASNGSS